MDNAQALEMVKFAGFALTAISALWGLTQRTTFDDEHGNRRLTTAGHLAALLFVGSAILSATAFGFETVANDAASRRAIDKDRNEQFAQARRDSLALQSELRSRADAADLRAAAAEQKSLTLAAEAGQRLRDFELARRVSHGSAANLARAGAILGQTQRLLEPLGEIRVEVVLQVTVPDGDSPAIERLKQLAVSAQHNLALLNEAKVNPMTVFVGRPIQWLKVDTRSPYFPPSDDPIIAAFQSGMLDFDIMRKGSRAAIETRESLNAGLYPLSGDLSFYVGVGEVREIVIKLPNVVEFVVAEPIESQDIVRTGALASVQDLADSGLVVTWTEAFRGASPTGYPMAIKNARLTFSGRIFAYDGDAFQREVSYPLHTHFVLARMGRSIF